jgi:ribosomal protein L11 methyltransferase
LARGSLCLQAVSIYEEADGGFGLSVYSEALPEPSVLGALAGAAAGEAVAAELTFETLEQQDWVAQSLAGLTLVRAGRFAVHGSHLRGRLPAAAIPVEIEAALAFGTGHHGTTRGCLLMLHDLLKRRRPRRVLDLGTGAGVLAIAAAKALHRPTVGSDIDPVAVHVARANARINNVHPLVCTAVGRGVISPAVRAGAPYDLVFANILLGPLMALARPLAGLTTQHANIVLSGLLPAHAAAALSAYRTQGFYLLRRLELEGWTTLLIGRG